MPKIPAGQIKLELDSVISTAIRLEPQLATRLLWFSRWIYDKKLGLLNRKPLVLDFLNELILDSKIWLRLKEPKQRTEFFQVATPTEQYWYEILYPAWFGQVDPKMTVWTQKLMADQFPKSDKALVDKFIQEVDCQSGTSFFNYILDLAMATDFLLSGSQNLPLVIQLTTNAPSFLGRKQTDWEKTLISWGIVRGVLLSHDPRHPIDKSVSSLLLLSDSLSKGCYIVVNSTR
jgi:hypothetical protein